MKKVETCLTQKENWLIGRVDMYYKKGKMSQSELVKTSENLSSGGGSIITKKIKGVIAN